MKEKEKLPFDHPREMAQIGPRTLKDPHSVEFAWQTLSLLSTQYQCSTVMTERYLETLAEAERYEIFKLVPPEKPYGSLDAMLLAKLGVTKKKSIENKKAQRLAADDNVKPQPTRSEAQIGNQNAKKEEVKNDRAYSRIVLPAKKAGSTSVERIVRRLKRDRPDIAEALAQGKYPSARAAGIAAGIVRIPTPLEVAQKAYLKLDKATREELHRWQDEQG